MSQKKDIIKSIAVLTLICLIVTAIMAVVNSFTAPVSAANAAQRALEARQEIIPEAADFKEITDSKILADGVTEAYVGLDESGNTLGYIITSQSNGFGGNITVMTGIDSEGAIICVKTMDVSTETSTLGGKTANSDYTDQYKGQTSDLSDVDTISGATITSTAYERCVGEAFTTYEQAKEAGY